MKALIIAAAIIMASMPQVIHATPPLPDSSIVKIGDLEDISFSSTQKYQLDITIRYNSLNSDRISEVISEILKEHGKACNVELKVKKIDGEVIFFQSSDDITLTPMTQN